MDKKILEIKKNINELSSFFSFFKKKKLKNNIFSSLEEIENYFNKTQNLINEFNLLKEEKEKLEIKIKNIENFKLEKKDLKTIENKEFENNNEEVKEKIEKYKYEIKSLEKEIKKLEEEKSIISILLSQSENQYLQEFKKLKEELFYKFNNKGYFIFDNNEIESKFKEIEEEFQLVSVFPELFKKNIVAVGGGFSVGKSEFISSFINSNIKLPSNTTPTTAISTYVLNSKEDKIIGYTNKGKIIDFKAIDEEFHLKISHNLVKNLGFRLSDIMPFMIIGTKMKYQNICFLDTPGYNPADKIITYKEDKAIAKKYLNTPSVIMWLINIENGTIPNSDIEFLNELELTNKKLYCILNKADLKNPDEIEDILDEIEEKLEEEYINFEGISAYSSIRKKEYTFRGKSLFEFLKEINSKKEEKIYQKILDKIIDIFAIYKDAIKKEIEKESYLFSSLHSLSLDLIEESCDKNDKIFKKIKELKEFTDEIKLKKENDLKELEIIFQKFIKFINQVFNKSEFFNFKDIYKKDLIILYFN